jgi:hypothetical protein
MSENRVELKVRPGQMKRARSIIGIVSVDVVSIALSVGDRSLWPRLSSTESSTRCMRASSSAESVPATVFEQSIASACPVIAQYSNVPRRTAPSLLLRLITPARLTAPIEAEIRAKRDHHLLRRASNAVDGWQQTRLGCEPSARVRTSVPAVHCDGASADRSSKWSMDADDLQRSYAKRRMLSAMDGVGG